MVTIVKDGKNIYLPGARGEVSPEQVETTELGIDGFYCYRNGSAIGLAVDDEGMKKFREAFDIIDKFKKSLEEKGLTWREFFDGAKVDSDSDTESNLDVDTESGISSWQIKQACGRAVRYNSHIRLPPEERTVTIIATNPDTESAVYESD